MNGCDIHPIREASASRRNPVVTDALRLSRMEYEESGAYVSGLLRGRPGWSPDRMMDEVNAAFHVMDFAVAGRNIVMPDRPVEAMLERTDLGEVQVRDVKVPHKTTYVAFSENADMDASDGTGERAEGVYLTLDEDALLATIVMRGPATGPVREWPSDTGRKLRLLSVIDDPARTLRDVIERDLGLSPYDKAVRADLSLELGPSDSEKVLASMDHKVRERTAAASVIRRATMLALNVLCYMTMRADDAETAYPEGVPQDVAARAVAGGRPGLKARQRLAQEGHLPIVMVGRSVKRAVGSATGGPGTSPQAHSRRGHWRRQRTGRELSSVTLLWIWPTMVRGGPGIGHVYKAEQRQAQPA